MIEHFRTKPYNILSYEALFRTLKPQYRNHKVLHNDYTNYIAGYRGEKNVDYSINIYPHRQQSSNLKDLRLLNGKYAFQIDSLIVTRKFMLIIEIKYMKGQLEYDSKIGQFIQHSNGEMKRYQSPILQAKTQKTNLKTWLYNNGFPPIPIETVVVVSNPSAILINIQDDPMIYEKLIHLEALHTILDKIYSKYSKPIYDNQTFHRVKKELIKNNTPNRVDLINWYQMNANHFIKGILCTKCERSSYKRIEKSWVCPNCDHANHKAHERKILDYFLLQQPEITNSKCRDLLEIASPRSTYLMLQAMKLKYTGKNSARKYLSPMLHEFPQKSLFPGSQKSIFAKI